MMRTVVIRASASPPPGESSRRGPSGRTGAASRRPLTDDDSQPVLLLVDDSLDFLQVATRTLESMSPSFRVQAFESGQRALAFIRREPPFEHARRPSLAVLDFNLADMTAIALLDAMRAAGTLNDTPVLVISQSPWGEDETAVLAAGARRYAAKPSRLRLLRDLIVAFWKEQGDAGKHPAR